MAARPRTRRTRSSPPADARSRDRSSSTTMRCSSGRGAACGAGLAGISLPTLRSAAAGRLRLCRAQRDTAERCRRRRLRSSPAPHPPFALRTCPGTQPSPRKAATLRQRLQLLVLVPWSRRRALRGPGARGSQPCGRLRDRGVDHACRASRTRRAASAPTRGWHRSPWMPPG